jgi:hypothetical protein
MIRNAIFGALALGAAAGAGLAILRRREEECPELEQRFGWPPVVAPARNACACNGACCSSRRNARSAWRSPVDASGQLAPWLRQLAGQNGVYLIRDARTRQVLYVGESHKQRLAKTLSRHLWLWQGRGSGPTYDPKRVEVAVEVIDRPDEAIDRQFELIRQLEPHDNVQDGHSLMPSSDVPF